MNGVQLPLKPALRGMSKESHPFRSLQLHVETNTEGQVNIRRQHASWRQEFRVCGASSDARSV